MESGGTSTLKTVADDTTYEWHLLGVHVWKENHWTVEIRSHIPLCNNNFANRLPTGSDLLSFEIGFDPDHIPSTFLWCLMRSFCIFRLHLKQTILSRGAKRYLYLVTQTVTGFSHKKRVTCCLLPLLSAHSFFVLSNIYFIKTLWRHIRLNQNLKSFRARAVVISRSAIKKQDLLHAKITKIVRPEEQS